MQTILEVQNVDTGKIWDISELVSTISWSTYMMEQPGKLTFTFIDEADKVLAVTGSVVRLRVDGVKVFYGYVFKESINETSEVTITAYDQLRYLKNKDTYVIPSLTASQVFEKICKDYKLKYKVLDPSNYVIPARVEDNKGLYEIIQKSIDLTLINNGNWYIIRDNYGVLEFQLINRLKTLLVAGDKSLVSSYTFDTSIDEDTYNQIKLVREDKENSKREIYIVKDSSTIAKWGTLQYFDVVDENSNTAQITALAEMLLKLKNKQTKTFKLSNVLGNLQVFAGSGIIVSIDKLVVRGVAKNRYYMVVSATHTFENDSHLMSLEMQVSI